MTKRKNKVHMFGECECTKIGGREGFCSVLSLPGGRLYIDCFCWELYHCMVDLV